MIRGVDLYSRCASAISYSTRRVEIAVKKTSQPPYFKSLKIFLKIKNLILNKILKVSTIP